MSYSAAGISVDHPRAGVAVVSLSGAHDLATAKKIVRTFEQLTAARTNLVADLTGLTFFDTTTIHALVVGRNLAVENGVGFVVSVAARHPVTRMLNLMRILQLAPVSETLDGAIEATLNPVGAPEG